MSADSVHSMVEKGIKKKKKLQDYQDLVNVVNEKGEAILMKYYDFFFKIEKNVSKCAAEKAKLESVQVVRFVKGSLKLQWKKSYDEENFILRYFCRKRQ